MEERKATKILNSDEKAWRFSYLKEQFLLANLERLFRRYLEKVNHAYFILFLISQCCISTVHFSTVVYLNMSDDTLHIVLPDLISHGTASIISFIFIFISENYIKKHKMAMRATCISIFLLFFAIDTGLPIYHSLQNEEHLRPIYTTHLIMACYIFLSISNNLAAVVMGTLISLVHLLVLTFVTYKESTVLWRRVGSDIIYVICINGIGIYFRFMHEIVERRGFLNRRDCIENNLELDYVKQQEEQLMLSILPKSIVDQVKLKFFENGNEILKSSETYLIPHENVTILYADIVNYTQMTTKLSVTRLVETLNDLFGSFDDASEMLKVLRIKFLGDCYYCVAGLPPECIENHADACVQLGLKMIDIIKKISDNRDLEIDMRIGVHTGNIIGGIIGTSKWQYDIWSKDVFIANRMETKGSPGKVHITKQTKLQLKKTYNLEATTRGEEDAVLQKYGIETFLVSPHIGGRSSEIKSKIPPSEFFINSSPVPSASSSSSPMFQRNDRRQSTYPQPDILLNSSLTPSTSSSALFQRNERRQSAYPRISGNPYLKNSTTDIKRRTAFMDNNIYKYQQKKEMTDQKLTENIDNMPLSKYDQWFKMTEINPFILIFKDIKKEIQYILRPDPLFKYYLIIELLVLSCIILIQNISMPDWEWTTLIELGTIAFIIIFLVPLTWTHYLWNSYHKHKRGGDTIIYYEETDGVQNYRVKEPESKLIKFFYRSSEVMTSSVYYRTLIYLLLSGIFTVCVFTEMMNCDYSKQQAPRGGLADYFYQARQTSPSVCVIPWHMTEACALAIGMNFLFLRIHTWLKFLFGLGIAALYSIYITKYTKDYYENSETLSYNMKPYIAHILSIVYLTFTLHLINRQSDYLNRLDHNWNQQLIEEEEKVSVIRQTNYNLLKNILPIHVANIYLERKNGRNELYCEEYTNVAVMFASIVNFNMEDLPAKEFVQKMDQIIGEFDELLKHEEFNQKIEKIKLANWTYMAACGLKTGTAADDINEEALDGRYVVTLLKFAVEMRKALMKLNKKFDLDYKLRIGICHGEVTAGVVGSKKPLYDIWGDTVNMASRMDSTGISDQIQITSKTAMVLQKNNITCTFRDYLYVKGKSKFVGVADVPAYLVCLDEEENLIFTKEL